MGSDTPKRLSLIDLYKMAIDASHASDTECAWALEVEPDMFKKIMSEEEAITDKQELSIHRFIFKHLPR